MGREPRRQGPKYSIGVTEDSIPRWLVGGRVLRILDVREAPAALAKILVQVPVADPSSSALVRRPSRGLREGSRRCGVRYPKKHPAPAAARSGGGSALLRLALGEAHLSPAV